MKVPWIEAIKTYWPLVRPDEPVAQIEKVFERFGDGMVVLLHMTFEAGRYWQDKHPTAETTFPDYHVSGNPATPHPETKVKWGKVGPELLVQLKLAEAAIETPGDHDADSRKHLLEDIRIAIEAAGTEDADC